MEMTARYFMHCAWKAELFAFGYILPKINCNLFNTKCHAFRGPALRLVRYAVWKHLLKEPLWGHSGRKALLIAVWPTTVIQTARFEIPSGEAGQVSTCTLQFTVYVGSRFLDRMWLCVRRMWPAQSRVATKLRGADWIYFRYCTNLH